MRLKTFIHTMATFSAGALTLVAAAATHAHGTVTDARGTGLVEFPDTAQYKVLSLDLHTHSVFSDGHVWPTIRVREAVRDGIDGLAITEHLEWQPHINDIPHPDRNRAFNEAVRGAGDAELMLIPGVEITRTGEPGHVNAVFITDANELVLQGRLDDYREQDRFATEAEAAAAASGATDAFGGAHRVGEGEAAFWAPFAEPWLYFTLNAFGAASSRPALEVMQTANDQGAFLFWNHPSFATPDAPLNDFHRDTVGKGLLHGVEIANGSRYYPNAHRLALRHDLALIGVSDVHELISWDYDRHAGQHRPVTLAFATDATPEAVNEALKARRTVVVWQHTLIGRAPELNALLAASIQVESVAARDAGVLVTLRNHTTSPFTLQHTGKAALREHAGLVHLPANASIEVPVDTQAQSFALKFTVQNALLAPNRPAEMVLAVERPGG